METHHADCTEVWLRIRKVRADMELVTIGDALDGALCFGWIDGQRLSLDAQSFLQRYSPRRPRSSWSRINVEKVERLADEGRMRPSGIVQIEAAKADGRWALAYERQSTAEVPADLENALEGSPRARANFTELGKSERYAVVLPLLKAHTTEERERVLSRVVDRLASGN